MYYTTLQKQRQYAAVIYKIESILLFFNNRVRFSSRTPVSIAITGVALDVVELGGVEPPSESVLA